MTRGVLYVAVNNGIQTHLVKSVESLRRHNPGLRVAVVSDQDDLGVRVDDYIPVSSFLDDPGFENVPKYPDFGYYAKVKYFYRSPYDETIFLDHDTYILDDIRELFTALENGYFHIMAAHDVGRPYSSVMNYIPFCLPTFNTGVVVYKKCPEVAAIMQNWWAALKQMRDPWGDQPTFLSSIYEQRRVRFAVLSRAYNYRFWFPQHAYELVKILHGRAEGLDLEEVGRSINQYAGTSHFTVEGRTVAHYEVSNGETIWN